ncbi:MAG: GspH/FimT family pseudopilin [Burkholderiales bacterium]
MTDPAQRGFSLIELMMALAILAMLLVLAAPNYAAWVADGQIRAGAESIVGGMRIAYAEAIKRNQPVEFILDPTTGTGGWTVQLPDATGIRTEHFGEGAKLAAYTAAPGSATTVTFNPLGQIIANNDASPTLTEVAVTFSGATVNSRPLTVLVGGGRTGIKLCDPAVTNTSDPRFCTT